MTVGDGDDTMTTMTAHAATDVDGDRDRRSRRRAIFQDGDTKARVTHALSGERWANVITTTATMTTKYRELLTPPTNLRFACARWTATPRAPVVAMRSLLHTGAHSYARRKSTRKTNRENIYVGTVSLSLIARGGTSLSIYLSLFRRDVSDDATGARDRRARAREREGMCVRLSE